MFITCDARFIFALFRFIQLETLVPAGYIDFTALYRSATSSWEISEPGRAAVPS